MTIFQAKSNLQLGDMSAAEITAELQALAASGMRPNDPARMTLWAKYDKALKQAEKKEYLAEKSAKADKAADTRKGAVGAFRDLQNSLAGDERGQDLTRSLKAAYEAEEARATAAEARLEQLRGVKGLPRDVVELLNR